MAILRNKIGERVSKRKNQRKYYEEFALSVITNLVANWVHRTCILTLSTKVPPLISEPVCGTIDTAIRFLGKLGETHRNKGLYSKFIKE